MRRGKLLARPQLRSFVKFRAVELVRQARTVCPPPSFRAEEALRCQRLLELIGPEALKRWRQAAEQCTLAEPEAVHEQIGDFSYFSETLVEGEKDYTVVYRYRDDPAKAEKVLDPLQDRLVPPHHLCSFRLEKLALSPDQRVLAAVIDVENNERPTCFFKDLQRRRTLPHRLAECGSAVFLDAQTVCYTRLDASFRPASVWRHALLRPQAEDVCLLANPDEAFFLDLLRSKTGLVLAVFAGKSARRFMVLDEQRAAFASLFEPRDEVLSLNDNSRGFAIVAREGGLQSVYFVPRTPEGWPALRRGFRSAEALRFRTSSRQFITETDLFEDFMLVYTVSEGVNRVYYVELAGRPAQTPPKQQFPASQGVLASLKRWLAPQRRSGTPSTEEALPQSSPDTSVVELNLGEEPLGSLQPHTNFNLQPRSVSFNFESPTEYNTLFHCDFSRRPFSVVRRRQAFNSPLPRLRTTLSHYFSFDGQRVPLVLVQRCLPGRQSISPRKVLMRSYGVYGQCAPLGFSLADYSLYADDWVLAVPLVRGGGDCGEDWHGAARGRNKHRTVEDILHCAMHLVAQGVTHPELLAAESNSAGAGLLAAAINRRPELFKAAVLHAPFLDLLGTLSDGSQPLSQSDHAEFGDPRGLADHRHLQGLCPVENLRGQRAYPALLLNCFEADYRASPEQAHRYVQRFRECVGRDSLAAQNVVQLSGKVDLRDNVWMKVWPGSHEGAHTRSDRLEVEALTFAFLEKAIGENFEVSHKLAW